MKKFGLAAALALSVKSMTLNEGDTLTAFEAEGLVEIDDSMNKEEYIELLGEMGSMDDHLPPQNVALQEEVEIET